MILLGISGKKGTGKDLLASYFEKNYGFVNVKLAGALKEAVRRDFNLTTEHTDGDLKECPLNLVKPPLLDGMPHLGQWSPREIMIAYGQFFRQFDAMWWVKKTFEKINKINEAAEYCGSKIPVQYVISDVRFKNEANYIKEQGGILIRLERKDSLNIYKFPSSDISETDLDNYDGFDYTLHKECNVWPEDLKRFADVIMSSQKVS